VEICGVYDVVYSCVGIGYTGGVYHGDTWWEAEAGGGVEGTSQHATLNWGGTMC
jgi:hypothetical protein